jgi:hypothetical protein
MRRRSRSKAVRSSPRVRRASPPPPRAPGGWGPLGPGVGRGGDLRPLPGSAGGGGLGEIGQTRVARPPPVGVERLPEMAGDRPARRLLARGCRSRPDGDLGPAVAVQVADRCRAGRGGIDRAGDGFAERERAVGSEPHRHVVCGSVCRVNRYAGSAPSTTSAVVYTIEPEPRWPATVRPVASATARWRWAPSGERVPTSETISNGPSSSVGSGWSAKRSAAVRRLPTQVRTEAAPTSSDQATRLSLRSSPGCSRSACAMMGEPVGRAQLERRRISSGRTGPPREGPLRGAGVGIKGGLCCGLKDGRPAGLCARTVTAAPPRTQAAPPPAQPPG